MNFVLFSPELSPRQLALRWLYIIGSILLVLAAALWWTKVYNHPERVFWGMVNNSLRTTSITRVVNQNSEGRALQQTVQVELGPVYKADAVTEVRQKSTLVKTESRGTRDAEFLRYLALQTDQKSANGKPLNFSKALNTWADAGEAGQLYSQSVFGLISTANLPAEQRHELVGKIKQTKVYSVDYDKAKRQTKDGRQVLVYEVAVNPVAYVGLLQSIGKASGLHDFDGLDPNQYAGSAPQKVTVMVDVLSRRLAAITYDGSDRTERYVSYGVRKDPVLPTKAIPASELQQRLQSVQ
jgi:hypothetical protein